ncbi:MAG: hypothetical protein Q8903_12440 [Bacteroidota bacterium]|nr:hypothetical protein [Bacteroidota bacterium]
MKKLLSILLIIFLVINSCGYIVLFQQMQFEAKREIKERIFRGISPEDAIHFSFSQNEFSKLKFTEEDEFEYDGKMFDIVKSEFKNGKHSIYCLNDEKEEQLVKAFQRDNDNHKAKTPSQNSLRIISSIISTGLVKSAFSIHKHNYVANILNFKKDTYTSYYTKIPSPPPKIQLCIS